MSNKFIVGEIYLADNLNEPSIMIIKRTPKMIEVEDDLTRIRYRMKIRIDADGNEYAYDSTLPKKWREECTYNSKWRIKKNDPRS